MHVLCGKALGRMWQLCAATASSASAEKSTMQPAAPLHQIPVPARRFSHVQVDLVGPLPASAEGHVYLLTAVDRSTRWVEAIPLQNMEATTCVDNFISGWVARFGVPSTVTTDRGAQFTSAVWAAACTRLGIKHVLTTAFHPQSNGMVERVHRQIKDGLRARGQVQRGTRTSHGCYSAYVQLQRRTPVSLQPS